MATTTITFLLGFLIAQAASFMVLRSTGSFFKALVAQGGVAMKHNRILLLRPSQHRILPYFKALVAQDSFLKALVAQDPSFRPS